MAWLAIWDSSRLIHPQKPVRSPDLAIGVLTFDARLRSARSVPVIMWQGRTTTAADFRLIAYPNGAVSVEHGCFFFETPPGFLGAGQLLRVHYAWDETGRIDTLRLENTETGVCIETRCGPQPAPRIETLLPARRDAVVAIDHAGIANHFVPTAPLPGFATGALIQTPDGPVSVETLRTGMEVSTFKNGPQPIRWIGRTRPLARGQSAPIQMRAPYFGLSGDIFVARNQRILLGGSEIDYLFGKDFVFARAGDLINGRSARLCLTQPYRTYHHILLDDHDCLLAGRCQMESVLLGDVLMAQGKSPGQLNDTDRESAWPTLDRASTQSYLSILGGSGRIAA